MARAKAKMLAITILATVAAAGVAKAAPREGAEAPDRAGVRQRLSVTGTVLMPDGSPAAGAIVESSIVADEPPFRVKTDDAGRFRIDGVFGNGGRFYARSADGNFQSTRTVAADAARAFVASPLELRLAPAIAHEVMVVAQGRPVPGAEVVLGGMNFKAQGATDKDGKVTLRRPAGETGTHLVAWHPELGVAGVRQRADEPPKEMSRLSLLPPGPHRIRAVDTDGRGVAGLEFRAHFRTEDSDWILAGDVEKARLRTDADGAATVPWAPRQKLQYIEVLIDGSDWKIDKIDHDRITEGLTTVHIRREHAVEGRLVMPAGASAEGILVSGYGFGPDHTGHIPYARARRDGSFTLRVPSGHAFILGVADREWASEIWSGVILEGDSSKPAEIALEVYPATPLTIRVTRGASRTPVADAGISVDSRGDVEWVDPKGKKRSGTGRVGRWWRTDADGVARGGVGKGEQRVILSSDAWREERTLKVASGEPVQLDFHRAWRGERRVAGRLTLDGMPYEPSRTVRAYAWSVRDPLLPLEHELKTRPDGTFEVTFDAENLSIFVNDLEKERSAFVRLGPEDTGAEIAMRTPATYTGTLLDEAARPLAGRTLQLQVKTSVHDALPPQVTDDAGRFRFTGVPADVPLQLRIKYEPKGPQDYIFDGDRMFEPGETREGDRVVSNRLDSPAPAPRPTIALADRLKTLGRDARLSGMHVLIALQGDTSSGVVGAVDRLLEGSKARSVFRYLTERVDAPRLKDEAAVLESRGWPAPAPGEVVLIALDRDGKTIGTGRIPAGKADDATRLGAEFLNRHAPAPRDALARLRAAREEAGMTGRRVWVVVGGPRCGPCFRLARWIDDHHATLDRDLVIVKVMEGFDDHDDEVIRQLPMNERSIPWHAFTEPDGTVLAKSEGPLGNIGFPSSVEGLRHFRSMLGRAVRRLTPAEVSELVESLTQGR